MTLTKNILSLLLVLLVCISVKAETSGDGWVLSDDGVLTITQNLSYSSYSKVPWYESRESVKSVVFGEEVTSIGSYAFYNCSGLTSVTIPESVTSIGDNAFSSCLGLTSIFIPSSVTSFGRSVFYGSDIKELHIDSIEMWCKINSSVVFWGVHSYVLYVDDKEVTELVIPAGVESISACAFSKCSSLTSVTIPESVTSIGGSAFANCSGLESIVVDEGNGIYDSRDDCNAIIETSKNTLVSGCKNTIIPDDVENIGEGAFYCCSGLTSITIPESVTYIGEEAFCDCSGLESIVVNANNKTYDSRGNCNAIIETSTNTLVSGCKNTIIPNDVKVIGEEAFYGCSGLTSITIPESVTSIGNYAFHDCSGLTSVTIPEGVTSIGDEAFFGCSNLTSVSFLRTESINYNGYHMFDSCLNLKYVFIYNEKLIIGNLMDILVSVFCPIERIFVPDNMVFNYRNYHELDYDLVDKFTGLRMLKKEDAGDEVENTVALTLDKDSYDFITWAVNSGEQIREGEEISIALTEDFDLDAENVTWQTLGTTEHPFKGIFEGNGHSIIFGGDAANSDNTLFGHIDEGAEIRNLNVENMNVMSGDDNKVVDGEYTYYPILAKENRGTIKKCVVSGSVMCDEEIENDEKSIGCFIVDNYGTLDHVVEFYKYGIEAEGNKRNIVIMQNMGVGRNAGQTRKVCNNRKKNKSLSATPSSDVNDDYREYTDEEMASGEPAYWLNYAGKGYTGDYTSEWSKGKMHPIMATELSKPAVKIVYDINGATESEAGLINPLFFANEDDEIEIETAVAPEKVWVGNNVAEELNSKAKLTKKLLSSAAKDGIITVHLMYSKATSIENAKAEKSIRVNGHAISIEGAEGESYSIVDVMGRTVAEGECSKELKTIVVPASGIYIVKAGETFKKIIVR